MDESNERDILLLDGIESHRENIRMILVAPYAPEDHLLLCETIHIIQILTFFVIVSPIRHGGEG
jgi:hypothetical protein